MWVKSTCTGLFTDVVTPSLKTLEDNKTQIHTMEGKRKPITFSPLVESLTGVIPEVEVA